VRRILASLSAVALLLVGSLPAAAAPRNPSKDPVARGSGGAVATVDPVATQVGLDVLRDGGNAVDAAVAAAATLGVTEPYSSGIGGGGFMLVYDADADRVRVVDGREEAPRDPRFDEDVFAPYSDDFFDAVNSGLSVGVPGTLATWVDALERFGTTSLDDALDPAVRVARTGFVVDETFASQTAGNLERFRQIRSTAETFLDDGEVPAVGSRFRNPDLADTYRLLQRHGADVFYGGRLGAEVAEAAQDPPTTDDTDEEWQPGLLTREDLRRYEVLHPEPASVRYRGYEVVGMPSPSSGGITVGEALNILESSALDALSEVDALHRHLEASALAFADRNAYIGDERYVDLPQDGLLDQDYADERADVIDEESAADKPVAPGDPCPYADGPCETDPDAGGSQEGTSTTHLVTADDEGNVVSYTLTIEQTGGSGITVPGRGFLLNNELTDFSFTGPGPNLPAPGKRPRSSMSPTIVLDDGAPFLAVGSPGGSTIIGTVLQTLVNRLDLGYPLPEALAAPRAVQRNTAEVTAEPAFVAAYGDALAAFGHAFSGMEEIGAATALEITDDGFLAVAEPLRRGGGDAGVVEGGD
jgi:gamma-glutamyltranspeptidase / glutathione hydrolase